MGWAKVFCALAFASCTAARPDPTTRLMQAAPGVQLEGGASSSVHGIIAEEIELEGRTGRLERIVIHTDSDLRRNACGFTRPLPWRGLHCSGTVVLLSKSDRGDVIHELAHVLHYSHPEREAIERQFEALGSPYMTAQEKDDYYYVRNQKSLSRFYDAKWLCEAGFIRTHAASTVAEDIAITVETAKTSPQTILACKNPVLRKKLGIVRDAGLVPVEIDEYLSFIQDVDTLRREEVASLAVSFADKHTKSRYALEALFYANRKLYTHCDDAIALYSKALTLQPLRTQHPFLREDSIICQEYSRPGVPTSDVYRNMSAAWSSVNPHQFP